MILDGRGEKVLPWTRNGDRSDFAVNPVTNICAPVCCRQKIAPVEIVKFW
jgi:hypothetical protein